MCTGLVLLFKQKGQFLEANGVQADPICWQKELCLDLTDYEREAPDSVSSLVGVRVVLNEGQM